MVRVMPFSAAMVLLVMSRLAASGSWMPGAMLPLLHALQHEFGFVPRQAVQPIAHALNIPEIISAADEG